MANFNFEDVGLIDYKECWDYQEKILAEIVEDKLTRGESSSKNKFLLVEHPHVYTLGKSGDQDNLLIQDEFLKMINATFHKINRGGDITYHGPGQLVGYPIMDLDFYHMGVRQYIEKMEDAIIETISEYGIVGSRKDGATGVWLDVGSDHARKICAIGVRVSRSVTMHGFALNVNTDMKYFNYINPCGFIDYGVTSIQQELGREIDLNELKRILKEKFNKAY